MASSSSSVSSNSSLSLRTASLSTPLFTTQPPSSNGSAPIPSALTAIQSAQTVAPSSSSSSSSSTAAKSLPTTIADLFDNSSYPTPWQYITDGISFQNSHGHVHFHFDNGAKNPELIIKGIATWDSNEQTIILMLNSHIEIVSGTSFVSFLKDTFNYCIGVRIAIKQRIDPTQEISNFSEITDIISAYVGAPFITCTSTFRFLNPLPSLPSSFVKNRNRLATMTESSVADTAPSLLQLWELSPADHSIIPLPFQHDKTRKFPAGIRPTNLGNTLKINICEICPHNTLRWPCANTLFIKRTHDNILGIVFAREIFSVNSYKLSAVEPTQKPKPNKLNLNRVCGH